MVVHSNFTSNEWAKESYDEYWKIANYGHYKNSELKDELKDVGYWVNGSSAKKALLKAISLHARGLLSYNGLRRKELKEFCLQRNLPLLLAPHETKAELVALLEEADEDATFRFMDLPPELRVQVYTFYFESLYILRQPVQPPISKVSRIVRQESLPVFYKTCTFILQANDGHWYRSLDEGRGFEWNELPFFFQIPEKHLAMARNLLISNYLSTRPHEEVIWNSGTARFRMRNEDYETVDNPSRLGQAIVTYLENMQADQQRKAMTRSAAVSLVKMIQGAYENDV